MIGRLLNIDRMPTKASASPIPPVCSPVLITSRQGVVLRCFEPARGDDFKRHAVSPSRSLLDERFAEQALRPEHQHHDEKREGHEVAQLVGRGNAEAVKEQGRPDRFDDP